VGWRFTNRGRLLLLAEDGDRLVAAARETWDVFEAL
jgi:hypothetical protein